MWESVHPGAGVEDRRTAGLVRGEKWKQWWTRVLLARREGQSDACGTGHEITYEMERIRISLT